MRSHRMGGNSAGGPPIKSFWVPHSCAVLSRMGGGIRSLTPPAPPLPVPCSLHPRSEPLPPNLPPQNRPRSIPTPNSPSSRPERSVVEGPPHFVVACFSCHPERSLARTLRQTQSKDLRLSVLACHPERVFRARRACPELVEGTPMNSIQPQPSAPFSHKSPAPLFVILISLL